MNNNSVVQTLKSLDLIHINSVWNTAYKIQF